MITPIAIGIIAASSLALFAFGANILFLTYRATRIQPRRHPPIAYGNEPRVCVQVPIYNERYVVDRVLNAVCSLDWPRERLEIQVLDDSDDDTVSIVAHRILHWRRRGVAVTQVRRASRSGFKAGALANGMALTTCPFIAIFDADFIPPHDFLRRTLGVFEDPSIGFAQARWGHLDEGYSWFTRLQAFALDFHFLIEQAVRSADGYFTNFTGTAGVWRRSAIEDSGGWNANTLTEDLDLSYRAQLRGWRAAYLEDLVVPEELPVSFDAYRRQQSRWATGSFQTAFRLLVPVLRSRVRPGVKLQASMHLLAYGVGPVMLIQLACYPLLLAATDLPTLPWQLADVGVLFVMMGVAPWIGFVVAQTRRGRRWWSAFPALFCQLAGAGMSFTAMLAMFRATRSGGEFVRTPKHHIVERGQEWRDQAYVRVGDPRAIGEAVLGAGALTMVPFAAAQGQWLVAIYSTLFALGFLIVAGLTAVDFLEVVTLRGLGRQALARLRSAGPVMALMTLCGALLLLAAQRPEPFEDGYGHWLIAANLASTGQLKDPIFGMQDTWLPGYHLLAATVLKLFGLWSLGTLKAMGAALGVATLALVYALAPSGRQGRLAVALLALNPVFLFTSGSVVVEPLMTTLLTGAGLAAVRGRLKLAAALAALACVTATKAWIWIGVAVVFGLVHAGIDRFTLPEGERSMRATLTALARRGDKRRRPRQHPALVWAVPSIALLVLMQLGFAPATNSLARGSVEVMSATARGSIAGDALGRLLELGGTFGLAALPLFALGAVGLTSLIRKGAPGQRAIRFVHIPALVYLAAVAGLVTFGVYTGSHRYLYPALPSLALLAAGALDRHATALRLAAVSAGGLLTIGFVPVFAGFANDNAGLVAAGRAASAMGGLLVTDSPVAAFYSGKPLADLVGSQNLPASRTQAIAWMAGHRVTEVVVEGISYYRASALFPDLAAGMPSPPFVPLGDQRSYQVSGGKSVYAYSFGAEIFPGVTAVVSTGDGQGRTTPLAKGLQLRAAGAGITAEGMGFGAPIVRYSDGWVYSKTVGSEDMSSPTKVVWKQTFALDEMGGDAARAYAFVPIASRGTIEVVYGIEPAGVSVSVRVVDLVPGYTLVGILNEQSAEFDNFAEPGQTFTGSEFERWMPATGAYARLRSETLGVDWSVTPLPGSQLHAGRELAPPNFNWAGLDYTFPAPFTGTSYFINVGLAK
ncbi:MAG: cellulose synthase family protein [Candidatus Dormiibacterota bacterium]